MHYRIPDLENWPKKLVNSVVQGDSLKVLKTIPDQCVALAITSPPYWNMADYGVDGQIGQTGYEEYLDQMVAIWQETLRVLIPNGKLAIVTPIMPISKELIGNQHTRHLKNINNDIEATILKNVPGLERYSLFVWQKQTSKKMFGSYPYPPNIYEDNTIEFINVFVKQGAPPHLEQDAKQASRITQEEWRNLTMQVWPIYPEDVSRVNGHPAPFPVVLPLRLIYMYTFAKDSGSDFAGDIVLDMFNGSGSTCVAARAANRNWIGIDLNPDYCKTAENRIKHEGVDPKGILLEGQRVKAARSSAQMSFAISEADEDYGINSAERTDP